MGNIEKLCGCDLGCNKQPEHPMVNNILTKRINFKITYTEISTIQL